MFLKKGVCWCPEVLAARGALYDPFSSDLGRRLFQQAGWYRGAVEIGPAESCPASSTLGELVQQV
jgi:hypothetical protein